jgi:Ca-activated chloride channel family protein
MLDYSFHLQHSYILYASILLVLLILLLHTYLVRPIAYNYSLGAYLNAMRLSQGHALIRLLNILRFLIIVIACIVLAQPQLIDLSSILPVHGNDMMLVLDVSGSMYTQDDIREPRRLEIAKKEAIKFIERRVNDPIGLVIFAQDAVSRCPATLDKAILKQIISELQIGIINHEGTKLSLGMLMAANRLKNAKSAHKVMVVLTDGVSSPDDIDPQEAIEVAKSCGITIYTIGIGAQEKQIEFHPLFGQQEIKLYDRVLLNRIAKETGGKFFEAKNSKDMQKIYETIDRLETTEYQAPVYSRAIDLSCYGLIIIFILLLLEQYIRSRRWYV